MENRQIGSMVGGGLVILLGILLLLDRVFPDTLHLFSWPLIILAVGAIFFASGLASRAAGLVIPGTIIAGIGGILFWQNATGRWFSWAYVWTLIPGFVGLGLLVFGWQYYAGQTQTGRSVRLAARWLIGISIGLFLIFTTFLGPFPWFWAILGAGLVVLGVILVARSMRGRPARTE
ncbi:MAG TPA: hypothetical protein VFH83_13135 [Spirochaetia bacterium]|nr:hypothetical protein [Spirochaetia bacterium]